MTGSRIPRANLTAGMTRAVLDAGQTLLSQPRPDLVGKHVAPTTDLAGVPRGERPRGSDARKSM